MLTLHVLQTRSNSVAWNPMEAFNLTLANEDCSLYTYDIRKLKSAACVHKVCGWRQHSASQSVVLQCICSGCRNASGGLELFSVYKRALCSRCHS